jgi:hypothetical protein
MNELAMITAALGAVKNSMDLVSTIGGSVTGLQEAEYKAKLAKVTHALAEVTMQLAQIQMATIAKDRRIDQLEADLKTRGKLEYRKFAWFLIEGNSVDGPFCQRCYDADSKLIHLQDHRDGYWGCLNCKANLDTNPTSMASRHGRDSLDDL